MPYTIKKNSNKEFCVHKRGENDKPTGKSLGCHKTKQDAVDQIAAIESKENKKMTDSVNYIQVGSTADLTEVNWTTATWDGTTSSWYKVADDGNLVPLDEIPAQKMQSIDAYRRTIDDAWNEIYDWNPWVVEFFDEFVIIYERETKTHYKVAYAEVDGACEFAKKNEWEEVKLQSEWVAKALSLTKRLGFDEYLGEDELNDLYAIKTLGGGRIGGYAILWGDEDHKDLDGEFFTPATKDLTSVFDEMGVLPFIVHHAGDDGVTKFVGGAIDVLEPDDIGLWFEAKTKEFEAYRTYVKPFIDKKMLFASSGTLPAARRSVKSTGEITRWATVEVSGTWTPAEYRMLEHPLSDIKSAFAELGVDFPDEESKEDDSKKASDLAMGAEKARLRAVVNQELLKLNILELD